MLAINISFYLVCYNYLYKTAIQVKQIIHSHPIRRKKSKTKKLKLKQSSRHGGAPYKVSVLSPANWLQALLHIGSTGDAVFGTADPALGLLLITSHQWELCACWFCLFSFSSLWGGWSKQTRKKNRILQPFYIFFLSDCGFYFSLAMAALMGEANKQFT